MGPNPIRLVSFLRSGRDIRDACTELKSHVRTQQEDSHLHVTKKGLKVGEKKLLLFKPKKKKQWELNLSVAYLESI